MEACLAEIYCETLASKGTFRGLLGGSHQRIVEPWLSMCGSKYYPCSGHGLFEGTLRKTVFDHGMCNCCRTQISRAVHATRGRTLSELTTHNMIYLFLPDSPLNKQVKAGGFLRFCGWTKSCTSWMDDNVGIPDKPPIPTGVWRGSCPLTVESRAVCLRRRRKLGGGVVEDRCRSGFLIASVEEQ